ncbi:MAG: hypothetical protein AB1758_11490 [Candidatus Eremiobacterota bacterium]
MDHFVSWKEDPSRAYDWGNYRYASGWINSSKSNEPSSRLLDPYQVEDGWFELILPSLQLVLTEAVPEEFRARAAHMLMRLRLRDGEQVVRQRRTWLELYESGQLTLEALERMAPLIARAVRRRDGL